MEFVDIDGRFFVSSIILTAIFKMRNLEVDYWWSVYYVFFAHSMWNKVWMGQSWSHVGLSICMFLSKELWNSFLSNL